ncbi:hypothetical protein B9Z19DRAFT_1073760, partial [Tuber borchii]
LPPVTPCTLFGRLIYFAVAALAMLAIHSTCSLSIASTHKSLGPKSLTSTIHPSIQPSSLPSLSEIPSKMYHCITPFLGSDSPPTAIERCRRTYAALLLVAGDFSFYRNGIPREG